MKTEGFLVLTEVKMIELNLETALELTYLE